MSECLKHGPYSTPHCRECDLDIIANVESEEPTMADVEWQDIATAPMWQVAVVIDVISESAAIAQKVEADYGGHYWAVDPDGALDWEPTHWMPLPTPPSSKGTNNGR